MASVSMGMLGLIKGWEGFRGSAYVDPAGVWTIGWGHTAGVKAGDTVTEADAEILLLAELAGCVDAVDLLITVPLNWHQIDALASFVFNLGPGALKSSTLRKRLNGGDYDAVPFELARWDKARNPSTGLREPLPGLTRRRREEGAWWSHGSASATSTPSPAEDLWKESDVRFGHYSEAEATWSRSRWPNFLPYEMACKGTGRLLVHTPSLDMLQAARKAAGKAFIVRSAYRTPDHNAAVGGAKSSQHLKARAYDIAHAGHDPKQLEQHLKAAGFTGFGYYSDFIHADTGSVRTWGTRAW